MILTYINKLHLQKNNQSGFVRASITLIVFSILLLGIFNTYRSVASHAPSATPEIQSTIEGFCIDDHHDSKSTNAVVDAWRCNGSAAQNWSIRGSTIVHGAKSCLGVLNNGTSADDAIVLNPCNNSVGQSWDINVGGYENPNSGLCLAIPNSKTDTQLTIASCSGISQLNEGWSANRYSLNDTNLDCSVGTEGQKVACIAEQQWNVWQAGSPSHSALLTDYSDGNAYEEWCADFVSYVYKAAGYPFSNGERDGWDEYDANNIQNMGFTMHPATGYIPKPGDVAFFNYPGGHVEIVVVGGKTPTFIYGDSGTTDPKTNNGEMNEDMLTSDGSAGQVTYYLSPQ